MGADIHGAVEIRQFDFDPNFWSYVADAGVLLDRNYDMFGCMFGVRNHANFKPIAHDRGIPEYVSKRTKKELETWDVDGHSFSFLTYDEIKKIDWEEESEENDQRIHQYDLQGNKVAKFSWSILVTGDDLKELHKKGELRKDDFVFKLEKMRRKDARNGRWLLVEELMKLLAEWVGDENVRLIVWFDN